jgi:hypothetical protein
MASHSGPDDVTDVTRAATTPPVAPGPAPQARASGRFAPGSIIAGRYRLVALVGRGGMGEVYRAEDMTLDHPVALKFLPDDAVTAAGGDDGAHSRLAQFHNELRVARQVSHKNVCRLYDLGEAEGRRFLTMEYVDGEDLASLLRRIGRIPQDKAIEIARQLCAGLAAAHERRVVHRDLKPANVMLDGEGNVRITDFGLAVAAEEAGTVRAGTPLYMAPEQLAGQPASVKTDIYALGLILFEAFTGKRAYEAKNLQELRRLHEAGTPTTPSSVVRDLEPAVERVILRCLERDPALRPASALSVAAALPGADPLAEALAAGETPSPDMLAAAGEIEAYPVGRGLAAVAWVIAGLVACAAVAPRATIPRLVPLDKAPAVLADRAEQILSRLGYTEPRGDTAAGFLTYNDYLTWIAATDARPERWTVLAAGRPAALLYWYRTSPRDLVPRLLALTVTPNDPPPNDTNMHTVVLDTKGRLVQFNSVPPQFDPIETPAAPPPWQVLFDEAGLPISTFAAATPHWTPRDFADTRAAWEGPLPEHPEIRVRVEAASYHGQPVSFIIVGPWSRPTRMQPLQRSSHERILNGLLTVVSIALLSSALFLARHNLRAGRADRRGATRLAVFVFCTELTAWVIGYHHLPDVRVETSSLGAITGDALLTALNLWIVYVALEPYGRRFWPDLLLGSSRLLSGHLRDPRVGRDILLGVSAGVLWLLIDVGRQLLPPASGYPQPVPGLGDQVLQLSSDAVTLLVWTTVVLRQLTQAFGAVLIFVVLRLITRRAPLAIGLGMFVIFSSWSFYGRASSNWIELVLEIAAVGLFTLVTIRGGLLAAAIALFVVRTGNATPFTLQMTHWSAAASNWTVALIVGLTLFGFYASRAGQPLLGKFEPQG